VLVDSGVLDRGAGRELPTGADEVLVADIYKAMARARSRDAAVHVTLPGVIEPGAELVVKNESDQPIRVVADPHETLASRRANGRGTKQKGKQGGGSAWPLRCRQNCSELPRDPVECPQASTKASATEPRSPNCIQYERSSSAL
jgi:hypothetical protein